jgi:nucleotide-binding universal stress UspA family protein
MYSLRGNVLNDPVGRQEEILRMRILFANNGSKPARDAGVLLRRLADPDLVEVTIDVCDSVEFLFPQEPWKVGDDPRPRAQPDEVAATEVALFKDEGFEADQHLGTGVPAEQILELVKAGRYDITMLGAGSSRWLENLLLGSTSTRVLHASPSSVLIVHRFEDPTVKPRVLLATDGSADAEHALTTFLSLADPLKVSVKVISVADTLPWIAPELPDALPVSEAVDVMESLAKQSAERAAARLGEAGFTFEAGYLTGAPVRVILDEAEHSHLVVLGSRGLGAASRLVMGSVSDQVARLAPATLVCRRPREPSE